MEYKKCCLCGKKILFGNNPYPVRDHGECCDECNMSKVIPARIAAMDRKCEERTNTDEE